MGTRVPYINVRLEGQDITDWVGSVSVTEDDRQADSASLTLLDPLMVYADGLFEGSVAEVDLGYTEPDQHAMLIRATITKVEVSYPDSGVPSVSLKGEDRSISMGLVERKKVWRDRTVTDIVRAVAEPYGFARVEASLTPDPLVDSRPIAQDGKTDLAFLQELAKNHHAKCFVELDESEQEVLYFIPERRVVRLRRPDTLVLRYREGPGSNLISFSPSFDSSYIDRLKQTTDIDQQGRQIESQPKAPEEIVLWELDEGRLSQVGSADRERLRVLYDKGAQRKREFQQALSARQVTVGVVVPDKGELEAGNDTLESRRLGMSASGSTAGTIWLRAKSNVIVHGVNERFSGEWYVSSVTHKIDSGGYKSDFKCVR
ncbi:phage late control D family protein [Streptomyces palmae]|uniref:Phage late control D family protein n=1 Tax=Streptomyces palmae TaxID=1701085 RepID=A0A4Z0H1T5_9ACTN|nr:contractile injection system protein, VgrG/Pvc8 family [Streptomyces palmae]TGB03149.1 phage late control D family protein [Streptomyces palmae]